MELIKWIKSHTNKFLRWARIRLNSISQYWLGLFGLDSGYPLIFWHGKLSGRLFPEDMLWDFSNEHYFRGNFFLVTKNATILF